MKVCVAGVPSALPAGSIARTSNVWLPSVSTPVVNGEVQVANAAPSTRHWNVEPASVAVNVNVGVLSLPGLSTGGERRVGGDGVDGPGPRGGRGVDVAGGVGGADLERVRALGEAGVAGGAGAEAAPSSRHWNVEPASLELKVNVARGRGDGGAGGRPAGDRRVRGDGVDGPGPRGRRGVDVADGVDGADLEGVRALAEAGVARAGRRRSRRRRAGTGTSSRSRSS